MKLTSATAVALLSGASLAAPRIAQDICGAAKTITITSTSTIISQAAAVTIQAPAPPAAAGGATITVTAPAPNAPSPGPAGNNNSTPPPSNGGEPKNLDWHAPPSNGAPPNNGGSGGGSNNVAPPAPIIAPTPAGSGPMVTAVDKGADGKQTVRACPTGQQNYECFEAVYGSDGKMITVQVIQITVTVINGESTTQTITKNGGAPQMTPGPEPKLNIVNGNVVSADDDVVTKVVDTTVTSTKNGKTVLLTSTHTTVVRGTGTGTASNSKPTHHVKVGAHNKLEFDPPTLKAKAGDVIRFNFFPKNHSVTACSAQDPCMENGAFDSGFKHTFIQNSTQAVYYTVENVTAPLVMFSKQKGACKQGMVFVINPSSDSQVKDIISKAKSFDEKRLRLNNSTAPGLNGTAPGWNGTGHGWNSSESEWNRTHPFHALHPIHFNDTKNATTNSTNAPNLPVKINTKTDPNGKTMFGGKRSFPAPFTGRKQKRSWF